MSDTTLYDTTAPSAGSVALAHQKLIRVKVAGVFVNITGDINNLALNPSDVPVNREVYGTKGTQSSDSIAKNFAPTFNVEVVRDPVTKQIVAAQDWFIDLYKASLKNGADQKREFQIFTDALDERMPVFQGLFRVNATELNTGYADKGGYTFTLTSDGVVGEIESPLAGTGVPVLESASPSGLTTGDQIVVRGYNLASTVSATIDGQAVAKIRPVDDYAVVLLIPSTVSGSAPIVVTNSEGASAALPYTAA
jgi:hypothetical protein